MIPRRLVAGADSSTPRTTRGSAAHIVSTLVDEAKEASGTDVAAFVVESGVCVLVGGDGGMDPYVVSRSVSERTMVSDRGIVANPVLLDGEPVAVLSASADVDGEDVCARLIFLAEMASARLRPQPVVEVSPTHSELAEEDLSFRPLFDAADLVLLVLDPTGRIVYANPYVQRLTGFASDDMLGQIVANPGIYVPAPTDDERREHQERLLAGRATSGEASIRIASGEVRTFSYTLSPVSREDGSLSYVLASAVDITERRAAEHRLHMANDALEQARVQAENSAAARSEFLARMSHEIRTPLNAIIGTTTLMLDQIEDDENSEHVEILRSSADHLLAVINDILDITKLDSEAGVKDEDSVFSVDALVESSLDLVMGKAAAKGLEVTSLVEPGTPPYLRGDAPRVRQVLVNLLSNAVKFTDEGVVEITGRGHYIGADRVELVFEVRDTGPGIPPESLDQLFDPFVRGDDHPNGMESTGLGLSISERLVHMLDGTITVQSTVGVGTRFTVSIPFEVHSPESGANAEIEEIPPEFDGLAVLIVDDIELNRRVLELETRRWGMQPTLCASALDALALVDGGRSFDLALLDLNMPDMNGDELAAHLVERGDCPKVLLSSTTTANPSLFSACLNKPIKRRQLSDAIRRALSDRPSAPPGDGDVSSADLRILVAEDNVVNQKVADALLQRLGYVATIVGDGKDVLQRLEEHTYDLVLLDLRMPNLGGIDTAAEIVQRYGDHRPRLVAFTASATEDDRQRCLAVGMDDFVTKPVTLDGLRRVVTGSSD